MIKGSNLRPLGPRAPFLVPSAGFHALQSAPISLQRRFHIVNKVNPSSLEHAKSAQPQTVFRRMSPSGYISSQHRSSSRYLPKQTGSFMAAIEQSEPSIKASPVTGPSLATPTRARIAFISGHTDLSDAEFTRHYIPQLEQSLAEGHHFIVRDAIGADIKGLEYLLSPAVQRRYPDLDSRITVYPTRKAVIDMLNHRRSLKVVLPGDHSVAKVHTVCIVKNQGKDVKRYKHIQMDANMTNLSDYDILYVRTEAESRALYGAKYRPRISGTELNQKRRAELAKGNSTSNAVSQFDATRSGEANPAHPPPQVSFPRYDEDFPALDDDG